MQHTLPRIQARPLALAIHLTLTIGVLAPTMAYATLNIPNSPLQAGSGVAANIMFIQDDSGSMHWEHMPDGIGATSYLFPVPSHLYGSSNYDTNITSFSDTNSTNTKVRSWYTNKVHYNPTLTYTPWVKYDGTSFGNASPTRARFNPYDVVTMPGHTCNAAADPNNRCMDLTIEQTYNGSSANKFYPITFYQYKGSGSVDSYKSYIKYQIRGNTGYKKDLNGGSETTVTSFTWPGGITRTVAEEKQNFANWFSYYRSRILTLRGGTGLAFLGLDAKSFRVGFTTINNGDINYQVPITTPAHEGNFTGTYKENFYHRLYQWPIPTSGTPLLTALNRVGTYYENATSGGPWGPDIGGNGAQISCRQSFAILTTDGYYGDSIRSAGNQDGTAGTPISSPDGSNTFTYAPVNPFKDSYSNTLADVAMKYWKRDLRTSLKNDVPTSSADPAFWQHMTTFGVSLGVSGTLDSQTDLPALTSGAKTWPNPTSSSGAKIDDLWHATVNGRGEFINAKDAKEYEEGLKRALGAISDRVASASNLSGNSTSITLDSAVFQASFTSGQWFGGLKAYQMTNTGLVPTPLWDAANNIPAANARNIITRKNATTPVAFQFANLTATQQTALGSADVVNYLRGDQSKEMSNGGSFRNRTKLLGDIIHSSPAYSKDSDTVFIGANDGMLHAFDAKTGIERFAYIPGEFLNNGIKDLSDPDYAHRYFVDGAIALSSKKQTFDKSFLVAALGRGGKGVFGLDVTTPDSFSPALALWDYTPAFKADNDMGFVLGKPFIAKANNGDWVAIFGNGYNSNNEKAVLYVVNLETGDLIKKIDTGAGSAAASNGLTTPKGWDADRNGTVDYIYAGDHLGNMWKFDLSKSNENEWGIANNVPMFVATDAYGKRQPITGGVSLGINPITTDPNFGKLFVFFGTGSYITSGDSSDVSVQTWYGLIDEDNKTIALRTDLAQRNIVTQTTASGLTVRAFSPATTGDMANKKGWFVDLKVNNNAEGERIVTDSMLLGNVLLASSIIPVSDDVCTPTGRGYINAIDPWSGGSLKNVFFDFDNDGAQTDGDKIDYNGNKLPIGSIDFNIGMPSEPLFMGNQMSIGGSRAAVESLTVFPSYPSGRISWRELIGD
ncbi:MAG: pilus assembly protein [Halothiobacillaceae bacterium]